jgi:TolB-like protein
MKPSVLSKKLRTAGVVAGLVRGDRAFGLYIFAALIAFMLAGCGGPQSYFIHPTADLSHIERVALVPFKNLTQEKFAAGKVENIVATELLTRGLDVVEFGEVITILKAEGYGKVEGELSKSTAEAAANRLKVQAFILGSVHEYGVPSSGGHNYNEVTVSLKLVDAKSYTILWEATHTKKGTTTMDRLFGIGKKSTSDLAREVVQEMLDTLFGG